MKKIIRSGIIVFCLLLTAFAISIPAVNDLTAKKLELRLMELPLPPDSELTASVSKAGKLTGNGNGMQYFAALLIESELTAAELEAHYSKYRHDMWDCMIKEQSENAIKVIDHGELSFDAELLNNKQYYIVYSWGSGIKPFSLLDIRGN